MTADWPELNLPELLRFADGKAVTADTYEARRQELLNILAEQEYGFLPEAATARGKVVSEETDAFAGKVHASVVEITFQTPKGSFSFPLNVFVPKGVCRPQLILHIAFRPAIPDRYYPVEEICDRGFATAMFCYTDITSDDGDFTRGLAGHYDGTPRQPNQWGKIGMWAYAASRALDWLMTCEDIDTARISVVGHSRLGKTALWAGANDSRFYAAISNNSGCSGAALSRLAGEGNESVEIINGYFRYWFCENYRQYAGREASMPFDQHFLLAALAPRRVYVCSAAEDLWANPPAEYRACAQASEAFRLLGSSGDLPEDRPCDFTVPFRIHGGPVGYHLRGGTHFMSRYDWNQFMDFLE